MNVIFYVVHSVTLVMTVCEIFYKMNFSRWRKDNLLGTPLLLSNHFTAMFIKQNTNPVSTIRDFRNQHKTVYQKCRLKRIFVHWCLKSNHLTSLHTNALKQRYRTCKNWETKEGEPWIEHVAVTALERVPVKALGVVREVIVVSEGYCWAVTCTWRITKRRRRVNRE